MNGSQFWELYNTYGQVYLTEETDDILNEAARPGQRGRGLERASLKRMTDDRLKRSGSPFGSEKAKKQLEKTERTAANAQAHYWQSPRNESYDAYDLVLGYLLDEGYCDYVEDAEVLMAHMSEEWIDSILDESAEEMARLRADMRTALSRGDKEAVKSIAARLADLQPQAQAKVGAELRGLKRIKEETSAVKHYQGLITRALQSGDRNQARKYMEVLNKLQKRGGV